MYIFWVRVGYCSNEHGFQKPWLAEKWSHHFAAAFFFSMENQIPAHCVCFAYEWIMSCQDSHMNESQFAYGFAYEWVMIRIWMGIRIWMSHDSHMNGSCHVRIPIWTAAMLKRWPPFARIQITFGLLPTKSVCFHKKEFEKCYVKWIPLTLCIRSNDTRPCLSVVCFSFSDRYVSAPQRFAHSWCFQNTIDFEKHYRVVQWSSFLASQVILVFAFLQITQAQVEIRMNEIVGRKERSPHPWDAHYQFSIKPLNPSSERANSRVAWHSTQVHAMCGMPRMVDNNVDSFICMKRMVCTCDKTHCETRRTWMCDIPHAMLEATSTFGGQLLLQCSYIYIHLYTCIYIYMCVRICPYICK